MINPKPTIADLNKAHREYEKMEPRDVIYRAGTLLVEQAYRKKIGISVGEALAVLLKTWNRAYYQYRKFDEQHFCDIEHLLSKHGKRLLGYRQRSIETLDDEDKVGLIDMFQEFEKVLGPVGTSKSLHLLGPNFFPIWDVAVAKAYGVRLGKAGTNGERYWCFMLIARDQCKALRKNQKQGNLLKAIDEYNWVQGRKSDSKKSRKAVPKRQ